MGQHEMVLDTERAETAGVQCDALSSTVLGTRERAFQEHGMVRSVAMPPRGVAGRAIGVILG